MGESVEEEKKIYNTYKTKFNLPEFDKVHKFLDLGDIDDDALLLVTMKKKIADKLKHFIDILEPLVHPDTSVNSMYENRNFNEQDKEIVFSVFKQLMVLLREADLTALDESDEANAKFINRFFELYPKIKPELEKVISQQKESWEKEDKTKSDVGYLG